MKKIKVGIVGLGRMGKEYAKNLTFKIRAVELVAACSINKKELTFAKKELGIKQVYTDYDAMLQDCLLYTSPSPRDQRGSRMPSSA